MGAYSNFVKKVVVDAAGWLLLVFLSVAKNSIAQEERLPISS